MEEPIRKISFLLDKKEIKLIDEACMLGSDADTNLKKAVKEGDRQRVEFLYEELDDLQGYIAACANHEDSERKQDRWDALYDRLQTLLDLSENMSRSRKRLVALKKQPCAHKYYIFDIRIYPRPVYDVRTEASRKIQIAGTKSLYNFAKVITRAFDFDFDHCFGFYDNLQKYHSSKISYELFVDIGEAPSSATVKGVKKTKINQVFKNIGDIILFLFDYGDGWYFTVELKEIKQAEKWNLKPAILESVGKAPLQYPPCEDELEQDEA